MLPLVRRLDERDLRLTVRLVILFGQLRDQFPIDLSIEYNYCRLFC